MFEGQPGGIYNISSGEELTNIEIARIIPNYLDKPLDLIRMVEDRPGRFQVCPQQRESQKCLNLSCKYNFADGIWETIRWYARS